MTLRSLRVDQLGRVLELECVYGDAPVQELRAARPRQRTWPCSRAGDVAMKMAAAGLPLPESRAGAWYFEQLHSAVSDAARSEYVRAGEPDRLKTDQELAATVQYDPAAAERRARELLTATLAGRRRGRKRAH